MYMASLFYLVLYLYLHACGARPLLVWDEGPIAQLGLSSKDVRASVADRLIITQGNFRAGHSEKSTDTNIMAQSDNHEFPAVKEAENVQGNSKKKAERMTLESPEETVNSSKYNNVEDIVEMDYAQPHRKPPIHNKGN